MLFPKPELPVPLDMSGRLFFQRSIIEHYKQTLVAWASGAQDPPDYIPPAIEEFVSADTVARELGVTRRTIGRRIAGRSPVPPPNSVRSRVAEAV
jgi:hypothetical protein